MAIDPSNAFETTDGIILSEGGPGLFSGDIEPNQAAPAGSMYIRSDGSYYQYSGGEWVMRGSPTSGPGGFDYHHVAVDTVLYIPENQHMVSKNISVEGFLVVEGGLEM